jgi:LPXTG-motif cell wall-anchored protein
MSTSTSSTTTARRIVAAGVVAAALTLGVGTAAAQDQHSGGVSPNEETSDPGAAAEAQVLPANESRGGLPVTGSDVAGLAVAGAVAVAGGSAILAASKRRTRLSA